MKRVNIPVTAKDFKKLADEALVAGDVVSGPPRSGHRTAPVVFARVDAVRCSAAGAGPGRIAG